MTKVQNDINMSEEDNTGKDWEIIVQETKLGDTEMEEEEKLAAILKRTLEAQLQLKVEEEKRRQEELKRDAEIQRTEQERTRGEAAIACAVQERLRAEEETKQVMAVEERKRCEAMARIAEAEAKKAQAETQLFLAQQTIEARPSDNTSKMQGVTENSIGEVSERESQWTNERQMHLWDNS